MRTVILSSLVLAAAAACVSPGDRWTYRMNRARTSNVIRDTSAVATVARRSAVETEFRVDLTVVPILGGAHREMLTRGVGNSLVSADTLALLREQGVLEGEDFRATWQRRDGACDWVVVDELPDGVDDSGNRIEDIVVTAKACTDGVPQVDVELTTRGRRIRLGFDRARQ